MIKKIKKLLLIDSFGELFSFKKIKELFIHYREIVLYIIFGIVTTVVNWIVYALMVKALNVDLSAFTSDGVIKLLFDRTVDFSVFVDENGSELAALFISNLLAWVAGVIVAFITNKIWVFESKIKTVGGVTKELVLFTGSRLITGIIEWFGLPLVIILGFNRTLFGIEGFFAKVIISVIVVILNYVFSKLFVFKKKKETEKNDI